MKFHWYIWIPRILIILVALFAAMFSLDVLDMKVSFGQKMLGLLMHNLPSLALLVVLLFTWSRPLAGGMFFLILAIIFTVLIGINFKKFFWMDFLFFIVPMLVAAFFFILAHYKRPLPKALPEAQSTPESIN